MTNRELAASLSENAIDLIKEILIRHECAILGGAKQILADAVREEREACALLCESRHNPEASTCADLIRVRKSGTPRQERGEAMRQCTHCGDNLPNFDVAHVCSSGMYAPIIKPLPDAKQCDWDAVSTHLLTQAQDAAKYQWLLRLFVYLGDSPAETLDAAIVKTMAKMPLEDV